jgi:hypothetical protein
MSTTSSAAPRVVRPGGTQSGSGAPRQRRPPPCVRDRKYVCKSAPERSWSSPQVDGMAGNLRIENPVQKSEPEPDPAVFVTRVSLAIDQGTQQPRSDVDTRVDDDGDALIAAACAALRVRCFYKYKRETERDPSSDFFLFGEAPSENEKDAKRVWRERRERAETNRARRFVDLGMRVVSFAATSRAPCAVFSLGFSERINHLFQTGHQPFYDFTILQKKKELKKKIGCYAKRKCERG